MKLLSKEQQESYKNAKTCYICKEKSEKIFERQKYHEVGTAHRICNLKYSVPK